MAEVVLYPMKRSFRLALALGTYCLTAFSVMQSKAFSLLGPFESWMEYTNGLRQVGDIGGPMCISNEYRWNVPVVTYGFDQSFIDYFGTNGMAAVKSAIQIIDNLPPTSEISLTNFPFDTTHFNGDAQAAYLLDLKSTTLALLLEQLGLAQPTRYIFVLKQWTPAFINQQNQGLWFSWAIPDYIIQGNFDPETLLPTVYIDQILYTSLVEGRSFGMGTPIGVNYIYTFPVTPNTPTYTAVADRSLELGAYYSGLSYDDVGGLRYLYSTNTLKFETLPPGVKSVRGHRIVDAALRPGINKIIFMPQPVDARSGVFLPLRNQFVDNYIINGVATHQSVERVIKQPDILFCAGNVDDSKTTIYEPASTVPLCERTGTESWINNAALNDNRGGKGPGVIQPPVIILFNRLNEIDEGDNIPVLWGTFDGTTNTPIVYPAP